MNKISPQFNNQNAAIVLAFNEDFSKYAAVLIESMLQNASADQCYDVIVLHSNISDGNRNKLTSMTELHDNVSLRFLHIDSSNWDDLYVERGNSPLSVETYYRLLIGDLLSEEYQRVIYLDADMVLTDDIAKLFEIELDDVILGACRDITGICINYGPDGEKRVEYQKSVLGIDDTDDYFIAGTMVYNLDVLRNEISSSQLMEMACTRNWNQHDQDIMNRVCRGGKARIIDASWNVMADYGSNKYLPDSLFDEWIRSEKNPKIIHYGGSWKPWRMDTYRDEFFWKYAAKTPFWKEILYELTGKDLLAIDVNSNKFSKDADELAREIIDGHIRQRYSSIVESMLTKPCFAVFDSSEDAVKKELIRSRAIESRYAFAFRRERKKYNDLLRADKRLKLENKKLSGKLKAVRESRSYKIGRTITAVPRRLVKAVKNSDNK
ncbi:MAG: glycosyltransferase family 8 protein [Bacillota bacterium]|nr:glycosyltransferase family 8 protein [Bacillota bacterium]